MARRQAYAVIYAPQVRVNDGDDLESLILAHSPRLREILKSGREQLRAGEGIAHDDFWDKQASPAE